MGKDYPAAYRKLKEQMGALAESVPGVMEGFGKLHREALASMALTTRTKELIALGIAITVRCDGCIAYHVHDALESGASPEEITETVGVAVLMGGGPSVVYGSQALDALEQFRQEKAIERSLAA